MLEGLEISEVLYTSIHKPLRLEAEYYRKKYLVLESALKHKKTGLLSTLTNKVTDGTHYTPTYQESGIPFLSALNVLENRLSLDAGHQYISAKEHDLLYRRCDPKAGDVLLRKVGVGPRWAAVIPKGLPVFSVFVSVALLRPDSTIIAPEVLAAFINSKVGQTQLLRVQKGASQPDLHLEDIRDIFVPIFERNFQNKIVSLFEVAGKHTERGISCYKRAETLLLDTLGMADFSPDTETVNIKSFKDSFAATGRLDAEYYQPKYEDVVEHITAQAHDTLAGLVTIKKSIEPGSDEYSDDEQGLPFLRVADYSKLGVTRPQKKLKPAFVAANQEVLKALKPKAGTILFSKDGSVGEAYCLHEDADFITSGAVLHLTVRDTQKILPDYLTLALNSTLVKMQAERDAGGSIILHWRVGEIENVVVPLVDMPTQQKIAALVKESFTLKAESERLLEVAKRAVEMAIEQDEAAALRYLEQQKEYR